MKTTLNQIAALEPNKGKFLDLMSYFAKTQPDDVEFCVTEILNGTRSVDYSFQTIYRVTLENFFRENEKLIIDFITKIRNVFIESFGFVFNDFIGVNYSNMISFGLYQITDRFEKQQAEQILAAKFLEHFKCTCNESRTV